VHICSLQSLSMPSITKARLEELEAAEQKVSAVDTLEKQLAAMKPVGNTLTGTFWLPRSIDQKAKTSQGEEFDVIKWSTTETGSRKVTFSGQLSYLDKRSGDKFYSKSMSFTCSDNGVKLASDVERFIKADTRLCDFTAFPRYFENKDGEKGEQWIITSITARPRPDAAA